MQYVLWPLGIVFSLVVIFAALETVLPFKVPKLAEIEEKTYRAYTVLGVVGVVMLGFALQQSRIIDVFEIAGFRAETRQITNDALEKIEGAVEQLETRTERGLLDCVSRDNLIIENGGIAVPRSGCYTVDASTNEEVTALTEIKCRSGTLFILQAKHPERTIRIVAWTATEFSLNDVNDAALILCSQEDTPVAISRSSGGG